MIVIHPAIEAHFHKVLEDHTAGDPMRSEVKGTNVSRRQIAKRITELGSPVHRQVVSPNLPGCVATGATVEATERLLREAIVLHVRGLCEDGLTVLEPSSVVDYVEISA